MSILECAPRILTQQRHSEGSATSAMQIDSPTTVATAARPDDDDDVVVRAHRLCHVLFVTISRAPRCLASQFMCVCVFACARASICHQCALHPQILPQQPTHNVRVCLQHTRSFWVNLCTVRNRSDTYSDTLSIQNERRNCVIEPFWSAYLSCKVVVAT